MTSPSDFRQSLEAAVAALQSHRVTLGDALVDAALAPLLERLAWLSAPPAPPVSPAAAEPARRLRQVSVLFLDLVGSTQLIQWLDPEEVQAVVDGALAAFTAIVQQHGGEVLRYAGDNLKAAFGAHDIAGTREDDAERAVHCGLALLAEAARRGDEVKRRYGHEGFNARVGIHAGGVVRGGGVENDKSLSGLTVNIAARLEQAAPTGMLLISQDTWTQVRGLFDARMQPPLGVKGVDAPITSWLVQGPKPRAFRLHARGIRGQETPLIGRQAELARFEATLAALQEERTPRAMTVIADAGLGKTRLLHEFQHILSADPSSWWLLPARIQPSGALQPYGLLRDLLARRLEIVDSDSADVARAKLVQGLAPWLAQPNDPAPELLGHLVGLDFSDAPAVRRLGGDARLLRNRAVTALRLWLERLSASDGSPVVLLLDDLHWADDASLDALVALLESASGPLLALLCARPGLVERMPNWGQGLPQHERLTLQPLDAAQGIALTRSLLRRLSPVPAELAALIERRAEGNPFYAEELVGMLLDQSVISIGRGEDGDSDNGSHDSSPDHDEWRFHPERLNPQRPPTTLTGVLQARLDALDPAARRALQMASVIGPVFWDDALGALDARGLDALPALQRKSLVQPRPTSSFDDTAEKAFQHHLLHQVTYNTVLKPQKREAHARTAAWLTQRVGDRSDEYLALTAEHFERADQDLLAADWFERASAKASQRGAFKPALQYLDRAEALAARGPEARPLERTAKLILNRVRLCHDLALRAQHQQALDRLLALGEAHGEPSWVAQALAEQTLLLFALGDYEKTTNVALRGVEVAERADCAQSAVTCLGILANLAMRRRDLGAAWAYQAEGMQWAVRARELILNPHDVIHESKMLMVAARLHAEQNDDQARANALTRALSIARAVNSMRSELSCLYNLGSGALERADLAEAAVHIDAMARLAAEFELPPHVAFSQAQRAELHLRAGQWEAAAREAAAASVVFLAVGDVRNELRIRTCGAEALWRSGRVCEAVTMWEQTVVAWNALDAALEARALGLRLADARSGYGRPEDIEMARQAVLAELPALAELDALAGAEFSLAARLAGWRVLHRAGDPAAGGQLALAVAELEQVVNGFSDLDVRERVRNTVPWHRDVVEAMARSDTSAA